MIGIICFIQSAYSHGVARRLMGIAPDVGDSKQQSPRAALESNPHPKNSRRILQPPAISADIVFARGIDTKKPVTHQSR